MSKEKKFGNFGPDDDLEKKHFGEHKADGRYPCMRDEYNWGNHRPMVPDSRVITKENPQKFFDTKLLYELHYGFTSINSLMVIFDRPMIAPQKANNSKS